MGWYYVTHAVIKHGPIANPKRIIKILVNNPSVYISNMKSKC